MERGEASGTGLLKGTTGVIRIIIRVAGLLRVAYSRVLSVIIGLLGSIRIRLFWLLQT